MSNLMAGLVGPLDSMSFVSALAIVSALLAMSLTVILMPLLRRYALARPNARSSHKAAALP
jgi:hypothetical protein